VKRTAFILLVGLLVAGCASNLPPTLHFPDLVIEGDNVSDPDFGYSFKLPVGFRKENDADIKDYKSPLISQGSRYQTTQNLLNQGLRARLLASSWEASVFIFVSPNSSTMAKEHLILDLAQRAKLKAKEKIWTNLKIDEFDRLTDLNMYFETASGNDKQIYRHILYEVILEIGDVKKLLELDCMAKAECFDEYVPKFYQLVRSLKVQGKTLHTEKTKGGAFDRLEELKILRDKGLITDEDYLKKKAEILNEL
jgi:hypothetical protein